MKSGEIRVLGIDLGTTNSAAAEIVWEPASGAPPEVRVLEIEQPTREGVFSSPLVPSVVAVLPDGALWVGEGAKRLRAFPADYGLLFEKTLFYDTKNEMGLRKTYFRASEPLNHASKIAGKVLGFIAGAASAIPAAGALPFDSEAPGRIAVTVPASFMLNQRRDTLLAAGFAGLRISDDDLLDEPTAALIDFFMSGGLRPGPRAASGGGSSRASGSNTNSQVGYSGGESGDPDSPGFELPSNRPALCVVFDFGGGTCDVSVVEISRAPSDASSDDPSDTSAAALLRHIPRGLTISHLSVSRYHRLGGGDIDAAIVHDILIPELLRENGLDPLALTFAQKKKGLEPQLLGKAEALKIAISTEISRLIKFGRYSRSGAGAPSPSNDPASIVVRQPSASCVLGKSTYTLARPALTAAAFETLLAPFLDTEFLFARTTEFRLSQSIFAPLRDAMDRADRDPSDVDLCLTVGGSSLIPQVRAALLAFFPAARHVFHDDSLDSKLCVARGAAWNALHLALLGRPFIRPVLHDGIALVTSDGRLNPLVPSGVELPFPADGSFLKERLAVPLNAPRPVRELRFEIVGECDSQPIFDEIWRLPDGVSPGDALQLEYRLTRGKQFECRASLIDPPSASSAVAASAPSARSGSSDPSDRFSSSASPGAPSAVLEKTVENPLVNIANPGETQVKIEEIEEDLRRRKGGTARDRETYIELARLHAELNQHEKALDYLRAAQSRISRPDLEILNLQGIYFTELGDYRRAETAFLEADKVSPYWGGPLFNLAMNFRQRGLHDEALRTIDRALLKEEDPGPYLAFKAVCLHSLARQDEAVRLAAASVRAFLPPPVLDEWALGWLQTAARMAGDDALVKRAESELRKRRRAGIDLRGDVTRPDAYADSGPPPDSPPGKPRKGRAS
ncbi:MAG: hypothetical protein SCM96_10855 [Acidobacteriota bacterium]|nr:hypothetical protein [Acidobacteriota bacterium]